MAGSLNNVELKAKSEINNPKSFSFTMKCIGSGVSDETNTTAMALSWKDSADIVQQASAINQITTYTTPPGSSLSVTLTKKFVTQGFKSFYKFVISTSTPLDQNSRIYFDFHMKLSSRLDS